MFCFVKQKTAYEMRISDWSSDVCSSDLGIGGGVSFPPAGDAHLGAGVVRHDFRPPDRPVTNTLAIHPTAPFAPAAAPGNFGPTSTGRSEERRVGKECVSTC